MTPARAIPRFGCVQAEPIIVGYDRSDRGRDALALARILAELTGAPLEIVSVHPYSPLSSRISGEAWEDTTEDDAENAVRRARADLANVPGATTRRMPAGSPALGLDLAAEEADASFIVVGSTGRGTLGRVLAGSTATQLLAHTHRVVAVAPRGYASHAGAPRSIAVAYDGGEEADAALRTAEELAAAIGAELHIVGVFDPTMKVASPTAPLYGMPGYIEDARDRAGAQLQEIASRVSNGRAELLEGDPAECLARASQTADLMVVGTHRGGVARRALLGSVSADLIDRASCPIVVVPKA
ncbi:MAG: UspA domain protein [Solirubrobacterales bacterium]|nr:UspA domain protein [Solirubrobacterales bacterium]